MVMVIEAWKRAILASKKGSSNWTTCDEFFSPRMMAKGDGRPKRKVLDRSPYDTIFFGLHITF
jgi:hypothetical protein